MSLFVQINYGADDDDDDDGSVFARVTDCYSVLQQTRPWNAVLALMPCVLKGI